MNRSTKIQNEYLNKLSVNLADRLKIAKKALYYYAKTEDQEMAIETLSKMKEKFTEIKRDAPKTANPQK